MPSVTHDTGTAAGSSPNSRHTGTPRRLPTQSCIADSIAARAAPWPCSVRSSRDAIASNANGSSPSSGANTSSADSTSSRVSP